MHDKEYQHIAQEYLKGYSNELMQELELLGKSVTPTLDLRVQRDVALLRRKRYTKIGGLVAACLAIAVMLPLALQLAQQPPSTAVPEQTAPAPLYEVLPLGFELPPAFSVRKVEQDKEKTVYYLENSQLDPVVMTLERVGKDTPSFEHLTSLRIGEHPAYGHSEQGYSLLTFEQDGVLYVLTCEHDLNTLVDLSQNIII